MNKNKNIILNKKIEINYKIIKKFTTGISLKGWEVKSIKDKNIDISKSYLNIDKNKEIFLIGAKIFKKNNKEYKIEKNNTKERKIKILLKKKEINYINNIIKKKKYTIIPISIIIKKPWYKTKIAICKGKKKYDKKQQIINKELEKEKKLI